MYAWLDLKISKQIKEVTQKRTHTVKFHLYSFEKMQANLQWQEAI